MKIYLDTSSLIKLYHLEVGTLDLEKYLTVNKISGIFLSEISKVEFSSTIMKKVRTNEISELQAHTTLNLFEIDIVKYNFVATDSGVIENARKLVVKYGALGLRTLDSIQLASANSLIGKVDLFITADKLLNHLFKEENLPVETFSPS